MDSILTSIKKLLGIEESYEHFDTDIIFHINSALSILHQLGIGDGDDFVIHGKEEKWSDFFEDDKSIEPVKSYVYMKVRKMFDPPNSSIHMDSMDKMISELEFRINVMVDRDELQVAKRRE